MNRLSPFHDPGFLARWAKALFSSGDFIPCRIKTLAPVKHLPEATSGELDCGSPEGTEGSCGHIGRHQWRMEDRRMIIESVYQSEERTMDLAIEGYASRVKRDGIGLLLVLHFEEGPDGFERIAHCGAGAGIRQTALIYALILAGFTGISFVFYNGIPLLVPVIIWFAIMTSTGMKMSKTTDQYGWRTIQALDDHLGW